MAAKTLEEFFREYRSGFNPVTGEQNLFKDLTDQHVWDAAIKSVEENGNSLQQLKCEIAEDLSEIESHSQLIQRKSVRVRELVRRLSHI